MFHRFEELKQLLEDILMADTNIADALNAIKAQLTTVIANQATPAPATVDLTPVLTAVQAVSDKIDAIDTPTS